VEPGAEGKEFDIGYLTEELFSKLSDISEKSEYITVDLEIRFRDIQSKNYQYKSVYKYNMKKKHGKLLPVILKEETN
jgi:hypothetical protein